MGNLRAVRKAAGLSQIELAHRASVSRFRLSLAEAGALELREDEIAAIRFALAPELQKRGRVVSEFQAAAICVPPARILAPEAARRRGDG